MKRGNFLIILGAINILTIFSGLPTGWKKLIIVLTSLGILFIGWILRAIEQRRRERAMKKVQEMEPELETLADEIADHVNSAVEQELDHMTENYS